MSIQQKSAFNDWFANIGGAGDQKTSVLCFPFSGSGVAMFGAWRNFPIPDGIGLYAAQLPGRETRLGEIPRENLLELAQEIALSIADETQMRKRPICLVGFSMGGLLAFEVARRLRRAKIHPALLVVGSARAPQGSWSRGKLHRLADDQFIKKMNDLYGAIPQAVIENDELRNALLPMIRADIKMFETYRFDNEPALDCEILTLLGTDDATVKAKHVYPWRDLGRTFRHRSYPGGHYFVRENKDAVLKLLFSRVSRAAANRMTQ